MNKEDFIKLEPKDFLKAIDDRFYEAKRNKQSRFSIEWGKWSREMNLAIKERIENDDSEKELLKYVFIYWVAISNVLELSVRFGGLLHMAKRRRFQNEADDIKKIIINKKTGKLKDIKFEDLAKMFMLGEK